VSPPDPNETSVAATEQEPLGLLLVWLAQALTARARARMSMRIVQGGITACGVVLMITPLVLWVAWSKLVLFLALAAVALAILVTLILVWLSPEDRI
jgi:uncharacterized membrane protein